MKKTTLFVLSGLVLVFVPLLSVNAITIWSRGNQSNEIKNIQEILKTDPTIYPEGLTTGYFGSLTERAIKKVQARCGIPQTGLINEETERCIYPIDYKVKVISPNGGENWDRGQIQTIKWEVTAPTSTIFRIYPFWNKASIDLFKRTTIGSSTSTETSVFVRHIATVDLFSQSYSWRISNRISNGENYVIRITVGKNIVSLWARERAEGKADDIDIELPPTDIWPVPGIRGINWDESDNVFQISGITPVCSPCPPCYKSEGISEVIKILEKLVAEINKAIALLRELSL